MDAQIAHHYPDLVAAGSLERLINHELEAIPSSLRVRGFDTLSHGSPFWAAAQTGNRNTDISVALTVRQFHAPLWQAGVQLASITTSSPAEVALGLHSWFVLAVGSQELLKAAPFTTLSPLTPAYEAGAQVYVAAKWQQLLASLSEEQSELFPLAMRVLSRPELSGLLPYTSHDRLCFSRYTGYPFSADTPFAAPLRNMRFRVFDANGMVLGDEDLDGAVDIILRHLPIDCQGAIHGTREQSAAQPFHRADGFQRAAPASNRRSCQTLGLNSTYAAHPNSVKAIQARRLRRYCVRLALGFFRGGDLRADREQPRAGWPHFPGSTPLCRPALGGGQTRYRQSSLPRVLATPLVASGEQWCRR